MMKRIQYANRSTMPATEKENNMFSQKDSTIAALESRIASLEEQLRFVVSHEPQIKRLAITDAIDACRIDAPATGPVVLISDLENYANGVK